MCAGLNLLPLDVYVLLLLDKAACYICRPTYMIPQVSVCWLARHFLLVLRDSDTTLLFYAFPCGYYVWIWQSCHCNDEAL